MEYELSSNDIMRFSNNVLFANFDLLIGIGLRLSNNCFNSADN